MAFSPKVGLKLPIENQNINIYKDYILVSIFKCDSEDKNFKLADKTLVGFAYIMWKECVERVKDGASDYLQFKLELRDLLGQVDPSVSVTGEIKGEVKWVEFGHAKSSFDKDGKRLETKKLQKTAADFKGKKEGEAGSLRIQFRSYTHSAPLDKKYVVRAQLNNQTTGESVGETLSLESAKDPANPQRVTWRDFKNLALQNTEEDGDLRLTIEEPNNLRSGTLIAKGVRDLIADKLFTMTPDSAGRLRKDMSVDMGNGSKLELTVTFKPAAKPKVEPEEVKMEEPAQIEEERPTDNQTDMKQSYELEPDEVEEEEAE